MIHRHTALLFRNKIRWILFEPFMSGVTVHFFPYAPVLGGLSNDVANQVVSNG